MAPQNPSEESGRHKRLHSGKKYCDGHFMMEFAMGGLPRVAFLKMGKHTSFKTNEVQHMRDATMRAPCAPAVHVDYTRHGHATAREL